MKKIIFILFISISFEISYSQIGIECNTGVTTELRSSCNARPGTYQWQGWACGINGIVIRCPNPPYTNWLNVSGNGIPNTVTLDNICAINELTALVCGHQGNNTWVWRTSNGGENWIQVFTQPNGMMNAIYVRSITHGFMVGNPVDGRWSIWKTTNGGLTWDSTGLRLLQSGSELGWNNSLTIGFNADSNKIWFGTNNSRIYYSSNFGLNWIPQSTSPEQNSMFVSYIKTEYPSITVMYTGGTNYLLKSSNHGINWITDTINGTGNLVGVGYSNGAYWAARGNKIYYKDYYNWSNYGYTPPSGTYTYLDHHQFSSGNWLDHYPCRTNGGITFLTWGEGVKTISNELPAKHKLYQNYPNPFNPSTQIRFDIIRAAKVKIIIFDILGRELETIIDNDFDAGSYSYDWNGGNHTGGIYFCRLLLTDKSSKILFSETKKMILIK